MRRLPHVVERESGRASPEAIAVRAHTRQHVDDPLRTVHTVELGDDLIHPEIWPGVRGKLPLNP